MRQTHGGTRGLRPGALVGVCGALLLAFACGDNGGESLDDCPGDIYCPPPGLIVLDGGVDDGDDDGGDDDGDRDGGDDDGGGGPGPG